ncbi:MAG: 30S ribosomal protein S27ae [Candidatus Bathyarchaeia archaeon]
MSKELETEEAKSEEIEEKTVEEKPRKTKEKTEKKKKEEKGIFSYYKIDGEELTRKLPFCERCGPGYFMAEHNDRFTCGHCSFTRYKQNQE